MPSRKRALSEVEAPVEQTSEQPGLLQRLRNCWEFANLMQFIHLFGKLMKIDEDFDIEDLENECLKPGYSEKLLEIGLCLLKSVSSNRNLSFDNFDEYTRRQYDAKAPEKPNPFGYDEVPNRFNDFDIFLKLRVLHQLSMWTFWNPDRIRSKMPEQREIDQTEWRIEELGYDREGRYYYVLDDNRLYRRTDPPIPPPKPTKPKAKKKTARAMRASKRRKLSPTVDAVADEEADENDANGDEASADSSFDLKWECVAVTLADYQQFLDTIMKTKDADEKYLRDRIIEDVLPVIEKAEEAQKRRWLKREKELQNMEMLAGAKRSSRIAQKAERERHEREAAEAALKHQAELAAARKAQEKQKKMEEERKSRVMTREQRIKDREQKRLLHEAELERIAEEQKKLERGESRVSERHLKAELEKQKKSLEELAQEDQWIFDCSGCGVHGENLDDGSHSVACEKCNVWQHSRCLGIAQDEAERDDFHFVCDDCKRREEEAKLPKLPPLKFRIGASSSPPSNPPTADTEKRQRLDDEYSHEGSPTKKAKVEAAPSQVANGQGSSLLAKLEAVSIPRNVSHLESQSLPPSTTARNSLHPPTSPERRPQTAAPIVSSPSRAPLSPSKTTNGVASSMNQAPKLFPNQYSLPPLQQANQLPPLSQGSFSNGSFSSQRPCSSHSVQSPTLPSPIQNRPSMSPTQGNRDVGPLAGFPPTAPSNGSAPWTPYAQQTPRPDFGPPPAHSAYPSFSAATPSGASHSRSSPPQSSHGMSLSGISPTKNSPRPMTSGSMVGTPVLPPIQKLEPSPKLMGRSSPDGPIPPPVKSSR